MSLKNSTLSKISYITAAIFFVVLFIPSFREYFLDGGMRWLYIFSLSYLFSYVLTPISRLIALRFAIVDVPDKRKIHAASTPLLGGMAIIIAFNTSLLANMVILDKETIILLAGGLVVAFVGFLDDTREIPAKIKLLIQFLVTIFLVFSGIIVELFPKTILGTLGNAMLSVIWIMGITNAMNFFDGMDGLAAGLSIIISFFMGVVAFQTNQPFVGWIAIALLGSCLGFLPYNFRRGSPATIFLGDCGSTFLGFVLAALAVNGYWAEQNPIVSFTAPILIFWVLIFDMFYISIERILTGKVKDLKGWVEYVGKDHLHHRIDTLLNDKRKTVMVIFLLAGTLGISAITLRNAGTIEAILLIFQAALVTILVSIIEYAGRRY